MLIIIITTTYHFHFWVPHGRALYFGEGDSQQRLVDFEHARQNATQGEILAQLGG